MVQWADPNYVVTIEVFALLFRLTEYNKSYKNDKWYMYVRMYVCQVIYKPTLELNRN